MKPPSRSRTPLRSGRGSASGRRTLSELEAMECDILGLLSLLDRLEVAGVWIKDTKCRFLWVNTPFALYNGLGDRSEVVGLTDFDLCDPALATQYLLDDERVLGGARIDSRIELVGRFDHSLSWCVTSKMPLRDRRGRIVGTVGISYPYPKGEGRVREESPLSPAMRIISGRFAEHVDRRDLARACGMSLRDFHRKFRETYGVPPHDYLRQLRVKASCNALVFTRKSLARIADEFGFSDQSHFTRAFRRLMGEPPGSYRARHRP